MKPESPALSSPSRRWLLVFWFGVLLPLYGFGWLAEAAWTQGGLNWDGFVLKFIHKCDSPGLDMLLLFASRNGDFRMVIFFTVVCAVLLLLKHHRQEERFLAHCVVGAAVLIYAVKALLYRADLHPLNSLPPQVDLGSPSAHSMGSFVLAFGLAALAWRTRWRWPAVFLGFLYAGSVALSRVYLGVHQTSDVLAGWALALAWVTLISFVYSSFWKELPPKRKGTLLAVGALASLVAILAGLISSDLAGDRFQPLSPEQVYVRAEAISCPSVLGFHELIVGKKA